MALTINASPGHSAGCGLKHAGHGRRAHRAAASPGHSAGCGLKPGGPVAARISICASPGHSAGCGLKLIKLKALGLDPSHHPAIRPGAD